MCKQPGYIIFLIIAAVLAGCGEQKQLQGSNTADTESLIRNQRYTFLARTAMPLRGRVIQLTSSYDLRVSKDSITAFLPYFGRAFSAPIGASTGGIQFTSTDFEYHLEDRRKGGWQIIIRPNDQREVQQMNLSVSENGSASLQVTSTNRQAISFSGYIESR